MPDQIGPIILATLSLLFATYGIRELASAYKTAALTDWTERAVPGAGGVLVAALFAVMTLYG
jgi:hypothetical protein